MIIFCDIDGVLFDISHRLHYQQSGDYESFYSDDALAGDWGGPPRRAYEMTPEEMVAFRVPTRLTLEQADLTKEKLRNEVAQLKQKLSDERQKNRQLKEQINDLKLKKILKDNKVKQTRKGKK